VLSKERFASRAAIGGDAKTSAEASGPQNVLSLVRAGEI
jgi:hypothetical protein